MQQSLSHNHKLEVVHLVETEQYNCEQMELINSCKQTAIVDMSEYMHVQSQRLMIL